MTKWGDAGNAEERRWGVDGCVVSRAYLKGAGGGRLSMLSRSAPIVSRLIGYVALFASGAAFVTMIDLLAR